MERTGGRRRRPRLGVLVVDGHRIFAEALAAALSAEPDLTAAVAESAPAALRLMRRAAADGRPFDVVLVAADLPAPPTGPREEGDQGIAFLVRLRAEGDPARTVVLADRDDAGRAVLALRAGASGWVTKGSSLQRLHTVVRGVLRDETHLPPALLTEVLREMAEVREQRTESELLLRGLTPREAEVLRCTVEGLGRKAVAERLGLSPHTVRTHMQNVLGKLGVHTTLAAVAVARRAGIGPTPEEG